MMSQSSITSAKPDGGSQFENGQFVNSEKRYQVELSKFWDISKAYLSDDRKQATPNQSIPVLPLTKQSLLTERGDAIYRLGHSTMLIRLDGEFVLIDPVFSERASFSQWVGPKRFHKPPITIEELPEIKAVLISHDHYDHLDKHSIKKLATKVERFIVPLEVGSTLKAWGVEALRIRELDWWQSIRLGTLRFTAAPAQHFSGRGLLDSNQTLWAGWAIRSSQSNIYYTGDTGYFSGFKEIGEKLGPFDITIVETGAYNELWSDIHMTPEQSVQAHIDLQGQAMIPVHNGTFDLALHEWFDPLERALVAAKQNQIELLTPRFGEKVDLATPTYTTRWWSSLADGATVNKLLITAD